MRNAEILAMVSSGTTQLFSIDPLHKTHVQQKTLDAAMKEAKRTLAQNRPVRIVVIK